jgi:heme oxygenase
MTTQPDAAQQTEATEDGPKGFHQVLRERSWAHHQTAEGSGFLDLLLKGELNRDAYIEMTAQHYWMYEVLEEAAAVMRENPVAAPFCPAELTRMPALERDMEFLVGADWKTKHPANPANVRYRERMREMCFDWPGGFVAHHYTRYLGDMSGGQWIAKRMRKLYDLPGNQGSEFYVFDQLGDLDEFKNGYRASMDNAPWDADEQERVIQEVLWAYDINSAVLTDCGADIEKFKVGVAPKAEETV